MPILEVEIIQPDDAVLEPGVASRIADAAASVFTSPPMQTWVRVRSLPLSQYAENAGGPTAGVLPVFVTLLKARLLPLDARRVEARQLANEIAAACGRPVENVHICYAPEAAGRIAFGGALRE